MTQSVDSMIEVLQAYKEGKKVVDKFGTVPVDLNQLIRWFANGMRVTIAPEPKKVKMEAWLSPTGQLMWYDMSKVHTWSTDYIRVPSEDKEILL